MDNIFLVKLLVWWIQLIEATCLGYTNGHLHLNINALFTVLLFSSHSGFSRPLHQFADQGSFSLMVPVVGVEFAIAFQEIASIYAKLSPPTLSMVESERLGYALVLLQV